MTIKREPKNNSTTKKRCPNGSRRYKMGICVKYATIKTFENLLEQKISETKITLSLESLRKDGTIMKIYERGDLKHQVFLSDETLQKAKKKAQRDIQKMLKLMHKIQKDPSKIEKDTKFKRMLSKIRGGVGVGGVGVGGVGGVGASTQSNTDILIDEEVMEKIGTKAVTKLEEKIKNIENIDNIENIENIHKNDKSFIDDIWESIGSHWEAIMAIIHLADVAGLAYTAGQFTNVFSPFPFDLVGAMGIVIMNIWYAYYPEEENKQYTLYTQYLIYSFVLGSAFFATGVGIIPNYIIVSMMGSLGLLNTFIEQGELNEKLEKTKRELVDVLENPQ